MHARANPGEVERLMVSTATQDGKQVKIGFGQDPGQGALGSVPRQFGATSALQVW